MEISVIVPVYNVERWIGRCLGSLSEQTFRDFEVVLVDDCCTDNSMSIVRGFAAAADSPPCTIISNDRNMGLMWTRKAGYSAARGRWFVFVDSDDFLPPDALRILRQAIAASGADIVFAAARYVHDHDNSPDNGPGKTLSSRFSRGMDVDSVFRSLLDGEAHHCMWAKIYDARLFDNPAPDAFVNQTMGEDAILFYQLLDRARGVAAIDDVVYGYFQSPGSAVRSRLSDEKIRQLNFARHYIREFITTNRPHLRGPLRRMLFRKRLASLVASLKAMIG